MLYEEAEKKNGGMRKRKTMETFFKLPSTTLFSSAVGRGSPWSEDRPCTKGMLEQGDRNLKMKVLIDVGNDMPLTGFIQNFSG